MSRRTRAVADEPAQITEGELIALLEGVYLAACGTTQMDERGRRLDLLLAAIQTRRRLQDRLLDQRDDQRDDQPADGGPASDQHHRIDRILTALSKSVEHLLRSREEDKDASRLLTELQEAIR